MFLVHRQAVMRAQMFDRGLPALVQIQQRRKYASLAIELLSTPQEAVKQERTHLAKNESHRPNVPDQRWHRLDRLACNMSSVNKGDPKNARDDSKYRAFGLLLSVRRRA